MKHETYVNQTCIDDSTDEKLLKLRYIARRRPPKFSNHLVATILQWISDIGIMHWFPNFVFISTEHAIFYSETYLIIPY